MQSQVLKAKARQCGADLVGIAAADRWATWGGAANPRHIQPRCQAVVVVGRRIVRGSLRGVEESTSFGNTYGTFGQHWNEDLFLARAIHDIALALEAEGAEAVPLFGGGTGLDCKALAHAAGLGSVGRGGFFLTPEFGHRQRFGLVLTDTALESDPIVEPNLCAGCDACLKACPLGALTDTGSQGPFALDTERCGVCANGKGTGPSVAYERLDRLAASCGRACLVALEDKIGNRFREPFRKRPTWTRDVEGRPSVHPLHPKGAVP